MSLLHIDMTQVLEILPCVKEGPTYSTVVNTMAADVMIFTMLNWINLVPAHD